MRTQLKMSDEEAKEFINKIKRDELYDEIKLLSNKKNNFPSTYNKYPKYLKAVRITLIALGYDEKWVESKFRDLLDASFID